MPEDFTPQSGADDNGSSFDEFLARYMAGERARAERSIDLSRFLSARTQDALQRAGRLALERGQRELDALHLLRVLIAEDPAKDAVQRIGADWQAIARATEERLPAATTAADVDGAVHHAVDPARALPRLPGRALGRLDLRRPGAPVLRARARPGHSCRTGAGARRRDRGGAHPGNARDRGAERRTGSPTAADGGCGIRHPDARPLRH